MATTTRVALSIPKTLFDQAEALAGRLKVSRSRLFGIALEQFIADYAGQARPVDINLAEAAPADLDAAAARRAILQGNIYWVPLEDAGEAEPGYTHPHVVIQDNVLNRSRIHTVVVCALTTNMKRAKAPGNVWLEAGEANLPRQSVVVVSQVSTVDKTQLGEYIGSLSQRRIDEIVAGMQFLQGFTERREGREEG
jgi:mRNA interferase MazF